MSFSNAGLMVFQGQLSLHQKALVISLQQVPLSRPYVFSYSVHAESVPNHVGSSSVALATIKFSIFFDK